MNYRQQAYGSHNRKKQAQGCIVDMIIPTNLVCILFGPPIPTSPFNFIVFYTCIIRNEEQGKQLYTIAITKTIEKAESVNHRY